MPPIDLALQADLAARMLVAAVHRSRYADSHEQRRDREGGGVDEEHVHGADPGDQQACQERGHPALCPRVVGEVDGIDTGVLQCACLCQHGCWIGAARRNHFDGSDELATSELGA